MGLLVKCQPQQAEHGYTATGTSLAPFAAAWIARMAQFADQQFECRILLHIERRDSSS